ncbi:MAG TPA: hypothetical protein VFH68_16750 [Polyangia bacterium]|nr:hypothetical protein [Polyangia bacterium]
MGPAATFFVSMSLAMAGWTLPLRTAGAAGIVRTIPSGGTVTLGPSSIGNDAIQVPEIDPGLELLGEPDLQGAEAAAAARVRAFGILPVRPSSSDWGGRLTNRSVAHHKGVGRWITDHLPSKDRPNLELSFDGLNFRDQRLANGGNQFSTEPPDQGLCVGNGFVVETVNDVLRVYDSAGRALIAPVDLNTFYGYPPAIDRATGAFGPTIADPSCYFDAQTQRWFHVALTLDRVGTTADLSGTNHLDIAVSTTSSPLGSWNVYRLPVQDDGSEGTPVHPNCPCLGDYPHIGADAHGFYITTNEFAFAGDFNSAQIYAISKQDLAQGAESLSVVQLDTIEQLFEGNPGFTVWPASSPAGEFERANGGTEYFLSSLAVFTESGNDNRLRIWAINNSISLASATPNLSVTHNVIGVGSYGVPPLSNQKPGDIPLAACINDTTLPTEAGPGCWRFFFGTEPAHDEVLSPLDSNDSRMQQVVFSGGKLYGALDTIVNVGASEQAGVAYYVIRPRNARGAVSGSVVVEGQIGVAGNNLTYPALAALPNGKAVMAFTLVGADHHPSAAYVTVNQTTGAGPIQVAAEGVGPQDGFTGYAAFADEDGPRPRWGDYGAAVSDGKVIWTASEYIAQTCTFAEYVTVPFGSCGGTRASLGNWATRISRIRP